MRIAFVSPYDFAYPGGVTNHIEHLSHEFEQRGHHVTILAPSSRSPSELNQPNLVPIGRPVPIPSAGSVARITLSVWRMGKVREALDRGRFDVVHIHEPLSPLVPTFALLYSRALTVATFHAYRERSFFFPVSKAFLRPLLARLDGRIGVSRPAIDFVSQFFPGDYQIIPNGIDVQHFQGPVEPFPQFMDGKTNLLFVGRAEKRKGLRFLVAAFSRLKWEFPDLRLIVVGPGNPDNDSLQVIGERGVQDVLFTGPVPYKDLPRYYHSAHIFCAPATGKESLGIVLLEAMAAGKPIVASNIAGYATVVQPDVQGLLVPPKSEDALAAALRRLLQHPELWPAMGQAGVAHAQDYAWPRVADAVLGYYETLFQARAARKPAAPAEARLA
ncbi:MAG: glycosyltransferase family 1 protein [Dehalococcoidia bacterium]|nr:glycosyltransferase family 1 protein [Dehalococcoidia bacterium]